MQLIKLILIATLCIILDQTHKYYMINIYEIKNFEIVKICDFLNFVMVWNKGISFGMFNGIKIANYFFIFFSSSIVVFLIYITEKSEKNIEVISFSLIIGGAVGNLIDRINYGAVADFFDFHINNYHYPAFNIADSCIFCGAVLFIFYNLLGNEKK
jgi:signal peptidase II